MIKVNLLNNKVSVASVDTQFNIPLEDSGGSGDEKEALVNFVLILIFAILLFAYELYSNGELKDAQARATVQLRQVRSQLEQKKAEIKKVSVLEEQAKEIENKLSLIEDLSKGRLTVVKALDFLQNLVPERAWLDGVNYEEDRLIIKGSAVSDDDLTEFEKRLVASPYFDNVVVLQAKEESSRGGGSIKTFEISCNVGVTD